MLKRCYYIVTNLNLDFSYTRLRDDPGIRWREEVVSEGVLQTAYANEIDTILTFDRYVRMSSTFGLGW